MEKGYRLLNSKSELYHFVFDAVFTKGMSLLALSFFQDTKLDGTVWQCGNAYHWKM